MTTTTAGGEHKEISFGEAGNVSVTVNVKWLDLEDAVFTGLRKIIRDLESLGTSADSRMATASGTEDGSEEEPA